MGFKHSRSLLVFSGAIAVSLLLPIVAQAHPGHLPETTGFVAGLSHPLGGLDHILAMVAVGLWAAQLGGVAIWAVPLVFVSVMAGSAAIGTSGVALPGIESGIILSDLILGSLVLMATRLPLGVGVAIVAILASFHGYAHGLEMPPSAAVLAYGSGFLLGTALLHGLGLSLAVLLQKQALIRWAGGTIVLLSGAVLINALIGA
jgi:urease accessory protein